MRLYAPILPVKSSSKKLIDFGDLPVFGDAITYPIIILSSNDNRSAEPIEYARLETLNFESLPVAIQSQASKMPESAFIGTNWSLLADLEQAVLNKLKISTIPLGKYPIARFIMVLIWIQRGFYY